jgi:hypothetical protein
LPLVFLVGLFGVAKDSGDLFFFVVPDVVGIVIMLSAADTILLKGPSTATTTTTTGTKRIKSRIIIDNFNLPHIHLVRRNDRRRFQQSLFLFLILLLILLIPLI